MNAVCLNYEHFVNFSTFSFIQFTKIYENLRKLIKNLINNVL
nr:MAG TPA: Macrophage scavenger receptor [Caudoviricetes sp.]